MMPSISIQTSSDVALAVELRVEFLEVMGVPLPPESIGSFREANRSHFEAGFLDDSIALFLATVDDAIAGCAMLQMQKMIPNRIVPSGRTGMVLNVLVREAFRRRGVGETLMQAVEAEGWVR